MRIISGKFKGKQLFSPVGDKVRPTSDRIKETIFNILNNKLEFDGISVLDLFAGSGALGIEAISRGAKQCIFIDKDSLSVKLIHENLGVIKSDAKVFNTDYKVAIKKLENTQFDLIIIDPPYALKEENSILELILKYNILKPSGIVYIEHSRENSLINIPECFIIDTRVCGNTCISFLQFANID